LAKAGSAFAPRDVSERAAGLVKRAILLAAGIAGLPSLAAAALLARARTRRRRTAGRSPRLIWGPVPIISIRDWSAAMRDLGYKSITCVEHVFDINHREDFDVHRDQFLGRSRAWDAIRDFVIFGWALHRADVFLTFYNGGFLRWTALRGLEGPLLRLAGKRLIVSPYGSDIAVPGHLGAAEAPLLRDYPEIAERGEAVRRRVLAFCRWADLAIRNLQYGFLPCADVFWPTQIAIDVMHWCGSGEASAADGRNEPVTVVHAPNHRHIKGTEHLLAAVEALRAQGLRIDLDLIERRPNEEVHRAVHAADIVAEQFVAGYGLFAIEGMAAGRPVLSAIGWMPPELRESGALLECPLVDADASNLREQLERLVRDPALRCRAGRAGREYVLRHHSREEVGRVWQELIDSVWLDTPLPEPLRSGAAPRSLVPAA
jgi:glycosyltransferase involved in cell wall biosynthesis